MRRSNPEALIRAAAYLLLAAAYPEAMPLWATWGKERMLMPAKLVFAAPELFVIARRRSVSRFRWDVCDAVWRTMGSNYVQRAIDTSPPLVLQGMLMAIGMSLDHVPTYAVKDSASAALLRVARRHGTQALNSVAQAFLGYGQASYMAPHDLISHLGQSLLWCTALDAFLDWIVRHGDAMARWHGLKSVARVIRAVCSWHDTRLKDVWRAWWEVLPTPLLRAGMLWAMGNQIGEEKAHLLRETLDQMSFRDRLAWGLREAAEHETWRLEGQPSADEIVKAIGIGFDGGEAQDDDSMAKAYCDMRYLDVFDESKRTQFMRAIHQVVHGCADRGDAASLWAVVDACASLPDWMSESITCLFMATPKADHVCAAVASMMVHDRTGRIFAPLLIHYTPDEVDEATRRFAQHLGNLAIFDRLMSTFEFWRQTYQSTQQALAHAEACVKRRIGHAITRSDGVVELAKVMRSAVEDASLMADVACGMGAQAIPTSCAAWGVES